MERSLKKRLKDILDSVQEIEEFTRQKGKRYDIFVSDRMYFRSIQMNIAIIGEAMAQILENNPEIKITDARKIVDTRNYMIHGYDSLSLEIMWGIVIKKIPVLKKEIEQLLTD